MDGEVVTVSRDPIRAAAGTADAAAVQRLLAIANLDEVACERIRDQALLLATQARAAVQEERFALRLVHRFGLDTPHGVALMQLAEALPRTRDALTAQELIADKIVGLTWRDAVGRGAGARERFALHALDTVAATFRIPGTHSKLKRWAQSGIERAIALLGRQYVLGETLPKALRRARGMRRLGYRFSFDMLGEAAMTDEDARAFLRRYAAAIEALRSHASDRPSVSVKLSALHPRFEERHRHWTFPVLYARVLELAQLARDAQVQLTIDAEEAHRLELTLDIVERLLSEPQLRDWQGLGIAVQAYQRRAIAVLDFLRTAAQRNDKRLTVRLVKGAYWDTEIKHAQQLGLELYPVFTRKCDTDLCFLACARLLLNDPASFHPVFATHNAQTIAATLALAEQCGASDFEFQRLHGMGEHVHDNLLERGLTSRVYAPVGPQRNLLPYLVRRLLENGASSSFVKQLTDTNLPLTALVADPLARARDALAGRNDQIVRAPTEVTNQAWPSARGLDWNDRTTSAALNIFLAGSAATPHTVAPLLDGLPQADKTQHARDIVNPANRSHVIGHCVDATIAQVDAAIISASSTFGGWSETPAAKRAAVLEQAAQLLEARGMEFIRLLTFEAGKTCDDAIGEVREAVDFCRYYAEQCRLPAIQSRAALGTVACISPWNFPLAIFIGQIAASLAVGNTVIAKPAEQTPLIASLAVQLLHSAGVPLAALQLLPGDGAVGRHLVAHPDVKGICFTGSLVTAKAIATTLVDTQRTSVPLIAETGGINAMIVDSSALPEQAVRDVLISAFQSAGQRCSALRILCVQEDIAASFVELLRGALRELRVGDPARLDTDVGPLIDADAATQIGDYLRRHPDRIATPLDDTETQRGHFIAPSLIEVAQVADVQREIFGPVLHIVRYPAAGLDALVSQINELGYGLTLGVHSRIRMRTRRIAKDASIGNVYVNRHQVGAVVAQQPFGGHGRSGTGPKAGGPHYMLRLSQPLNEECAMECADIFWSTAPLETGVLSRLERVRQAQHRWAQMTQRSEKVQFACTMMAANRAHPAAQVAHRTYLPGSNSLQHLLPSIDGEHNTLLLRPRGVLVCIAAAESLDCLASALFRAVAMGNGLLLLYRTEHQEALHETLAELRQAGMPDDLVLAQPLAVTASTLTIGRDYFTALNIDGVICDGHEANLNGIATLLAKRDGALLPLIRSNEELYRFAVEQTVTINTAAAGGDPKLLGAAVHALENMQ